MTPFLTVVVFILMFGVLVAVHEWGHYLAARWMKMGVEEFAIGFGKVLKTWKRKQVTMSNGDTHETVFNIRAIPLGGFVRITGMEPKEDGAEVNVPHGFYSKPPYQRIITLFAGPLFSMLFGVIILFSVFAGIGLKTASTTVEKVTPDMPAIKAGIRANDTITAINDKPVKEAFDAMMIIRESLGKPVVVSISRDSGVSKYTVTPVLSKEEHELTDKDGLPTGKKGKIPRIGIEFAAKSVRVPVGLALQSSVEAPIIAVKRLLFRLHQPAEVLKETTGVIGIAAATNSAVEEGLERVILNCGLLSIGLGVTNLLPIGMLDGGQILLALVEMLNRGKRLSFKVQTGFLTAGMALMLILFLVITRQDIIRFVLPK